MHYLVAFNHRVVSGRRVGHVRYAARRTRYQFVARQQFAFGHRHGAVAMGCSVICPAAIGGLDRDRHFSRLHRQLAIRCRYAVVVRCSGCELVARQFVRYRAFARERDAARYDRFNRVVAHQAVHVVLRPALLCSVIGEFLVLGRDRYGLRIDRQRAGFSRDHIVLGHVLFAVHHLVACCDRVVAIRRISHVRRAARRSRYQLVASEQFTAGHGHLAVRQGASVVGLLVARRRDRDLHGGLHHRQFAVFSGYAVVAGCSGRELVARQLVRYRALARERDAARYDRFNRVVAHQAVHVVLRPALRCSIIGEFLVLSRDRYGLRIDRQRAGFSRDLIVLGHVFFAVHHLVAFNHRVVAGLRIGYVRYAARRARYQLVARQQVAFAYRHSRVAMGLSVVRPALACCRDRDRAGSDLQLTRLPLHIGEEMRYILLSCIFNNGIALHCVVNITDIGNASFNHSINRIAFRQSVNIESILCQGCAVIHLAGILCRDSDQLAIRLCVFQVCAVIPVPACEGITCDAVFGVAIFGAVQPSGRFLEPFALSYAAMDKVLLDKPSLYIAALNIMFDSVIVVIHNTGFSRCTVSICLLVEIQGYTTEAVLASRNLILSRLKLVIAIRILFGKRCFDRSDVQSVIIFRRMIGILHSINRQEIGQLLLH